jgi:hypothetical membrane protein
VISDLGASEPPESVIVQPSGTIFNATMIVAGLLILAGTVFVFRSLRARGFPVLLALLGIGALGVGIFPGNYGDLHAIMALMTFVAGGLSAIAAFTVTRPPFRYISVIPGILGLLPLLLFYVMGTLNPFVILGYGGLERWIAYPIVLWVTGFGGYLMGFSAPDSAEP